MKKTKIKKDLSNKIKEIGSGNTIRGITLISLSITLLLIAVSGVSVYATATYMANQVKYKIEGRNDIKSVADALNDLYSNQNLSVELIKNSYSNGFITATTTKDYDYIIIAGCKWYYSGSHIASSFTVTGDYESYINKFGKQGNSLTDDDASDIAIIKNVKKDAVIKVGEGNSSVYKNLNIVGVCSK